MTEISSPKKFTHPLEDIIESQDSELEFTATYLGCFFMSLIWSKPDIITHLKPQKQKGPPERSLINKPFDLQANTYLL